MKMKRGKGKFPQERSQPCGPLRSQVRAMIIVGNCFLTSYMSSKP